MNDDLKGHSGKVSQGQGPPVILSQKEISCTKSSPAPFPLPLSRSDRLGLTCYEWWSQGQVKGSRGQGPLAMLSQKINRSEPSPFPPFPHQRSITVIQALSPSLSLFWGLTDSQAANVWPLGQLNDSQERGPLAMLSRKEIYRSESTPVPSPLPLLRSDRLTR